ncbi:hypothetical protein [Tautonia plasticadhaerens]|uniref:Uncharacterized protein n=1 Tax=Tautonia plasticadhaerens TaxID=2527974 RepID=A0A518HBM1_9BACT|nr:hypothetical protein [Tautonia plasticadhaerens]QDV38258.1 hypothetical protein ElP_62090 [Tautonia plasticadhaerens]
MRRTYPRFRIWMAMAAIALLAAPLANTMRLRRERSPASQQRMMIRALEEFKARHGDRSPTRIVWGDGTLVVPPPRP